MTRCAPSPRHLGIALLLAATSLPALAIYKVIGPDGKVTYTDTPPADAAQVRPVGGAVAAVAGTPDTSMLPSELRQVASRYPVTLHTTSDCAPCDTARQMLRQRGVPFAERSYGKSGADQAALKAATGGGTMLPSLTVGRQAVKDGYNAASWNSYLDAAGYPTESRLPSSYRPPAPVPAVAPSEASAPAAAAPAAPAPTPAPAPAARPASGPNIRF
ncbi:DUF4124 domain-containing protein [Ideonella sp.]|uniref:DUF4124 domain-containing protein n=1 Tax=Ideonella sp. TaxID=1929293 RepID=UPI0035B4B967